MNIANIAKPNGNSGIGAAVTVTVCSKDPKATPPVPKQYVPGVSEEGIVITIDQEPPD